MTYLLDHDLLIKNDNNGRSDKNNSRGYVAAMISNGDEKDIVLWFGKKFLLKNAKQEFCSCFLFLGFFLSIKRHEGLISKEI